MIPMTLTVPARSDWALVLRMAASGVGALYDLPIDVLDDLKTAIDEAADLLLHQDYCAESLTLTCEGTPEGLHVSLTAQKCQEAHSDAPVDAGIAQLIIGTLVKQVHLDESEHGILGVHMTLPAQL